MAHLPKRPLTVLTWIITLWEALTLGLAGFAKLGGSADLWAGWFASFGYAAWFSTTIGVLELAGGLALLAPKLTSYAASGLGVIMLGALYTVLTNETTLGAVTPIIHLVFLASLIKLRWGSRLGGAAPSGGDVSAPATMSASQVGH